MSQTLPFPVKSPLLEPQIEQYFYEGRDVRCSDEAYHFAVWLPREWQLVDDIPVQPPSREAPSLLASFRPTAGPEATLTITAVPLAREMAPADWLDLFLEAAGEVVVARRTIDMPGGAVADVLTRCASEREAVISRWLVLKDYNRLFLLHAHCKEEQYRSHALGFFMMLTSFRLLHPVGWPYAEDLRSFSRRLPGDFCLFYPASWTIQRDPATGEQALEVHILNQGGEAVQGDMSVIVLPRAAESHPQRLVDLFVDHVRQKGERLSPVLLAPAEPVGGFLETWQGQACAAETGMELRVTVGRRPEAWFLVALLGPARAAQGAVWAVNKRAYDLLLDLFHTSSAEQVAAAETSCVQA